MSAVSARLSAVFYFAAGVCSGLLLVGAAAVLVVLRISSRGPRPPSRGRLPGSTGGPVSHATASSAGRLPKSLYRPDLVTDVESCVWFSAFCGRMYRDFVSR